MATHWTDKRAAMALVGKELRSRGWKLYGWKEDESDSMSDYYSPEDWDGIAEKDGAVAVVDRRDTRDSGGRNKVRYEPGAACDRCNGLRADPSGWTPEAAKADPRAFNRDECSDRPGSFMLFSDVVSPIPFFSGCFNSPNHPDGAPELRGRRVCRRCNGRGHMLVSVDYTEPWPTFSPNPKGRVWHVERAGRIIASGVGVFAVASERWSQGAPHPKLDALCDRIEAAAFQKLGSRDDARETEHASYTSVDAVTISPGTKPGFVEVRFPEKPAPEVLDELKAARFRWSRHSACWYGPASNLPTQYGPPPHQDDSREGVTRTVAAYESPDNVCPDGPTCTDPECIAARAERA